MVGKILPLTKKKEIQQTTMTDTQIQDLQQENEKLQEEIKSLKEENKELNEAETFHIQEIQELETTYKKLKEKITCLESDIDARVWQSREDFDEIEELKEKITCLESDSCNEVSQSEHDEAIKKLKEENEKLFKFTIGGGEASEVEKIITEKMTKEFIVENHEHWGEIGLFQELKPEPGKVSQ